LSGYAVVITVSQSSKGGKNPVNAGDVLSLQVANLLRLQEPPGPAVEVNYLVGVGIDALFNVCFEAQVEPDAGQILRDYAKQKQKFQNRTDTFRENKVLGNKSQNCLPKLRVALDHLPELDYSQVSEQKYHVV
jgi:hypothetical protein